MGKPITWLALLTIDAAPADEAQLIADLPAGAEVFIEPQGGHCGADFVRTGIAMRFSALTLIAAQAKALNAVRDSLPNLGHTPVTSLQVFTYEDAERDVATGGFATFLHLLFGAYDRIEKAAAEKTLTGLLDA